MAHASSLIIGIAAALASSALASTGVVLQAFDARGVEHHHGLRMTMLGRLLRRRRWLIGTVIIYLAFPFQLLALGHAPLMVVQPVHACGLLIVLAAGIAVLRERVGALERTGAAAIVIGVALLAWGAPAGRDREVSQPLYGAVTVLLIGIEAVPFALGPRCGRVVLLVCTGAGFAAVNVAVKGFSDHVAFHHYLAAAGYLAGAGVASTAALLAQAAAFQRHPAVEVVPVTYAITNFLPVMLALLVLQERWSQAALSGIPFVVGVVALLAGTAVIAHARPVAQLLRRAAG